MADILMWLMYVDAPLFRNYYRNSAATPDCDKLCKIQVLCDLKSGKSQSRKQLCSDLELA
ncbi:unnamed protein product [Callosobruchus maculatus]|uniref:Uncharacterized protein n=1 Tax=Callosobruchus maculatus TaxID=64391 RepID=A0A653DRT3_CALMS|nr:unnamed protein product [Callosobruchus maculatus]